MTAEQRTAMQTIRDLQRRIEVLEHRHHNELGKMQSALDKARRRIAYLERDNRRWLERARQAELEGKYWHGRALVG